MIITHSGKISENFYLIGPPVAPIYLLDGDEPILFDGGFTTLSYLYEKGLKKILKDRSPVHLFITHSHFDHIGAISHIKSIWPDIKISATKKCRDILSKDNAVQLMRKLSDESTKGFHRMSFKPLYEKPFEPFDVDNLICPDQKISISPGLSIIPLNTPGHTWDFMSYFIPEKKILIASEAVAVYEGNDDIQPEFLVDASAYLESLKKLKKFDINILCAGHFAVFTDEDAINHIDQSINATINYRFMVENLLCEESGDVDRVAIKIKNIEWVNRAMPKQSEAAYMINTKQRVRTVLKNMNNKYL